MYVYLFIYPSIYLSIYLSIHIYAYTSIYTDTHIYIHLVLRQRVPQDRGAALKLYRQGKILLHTIGASFAKLRVEKLGVGVSGLCLCPNPGRRGCFEAFLAIAQPEHKRVAAPRRHLQNETGRRVGPMGVVVEEKNDAGWQGVAEDSRLSWQSLSQSTSE